MTTRHILRNVVFFLMFSNKLYEATIKRKLQHSGGISKFTDPSPLVHYTYLYKITTSRVKIDLN